MKWFGPNHKLIDYLTTLSTTQQDDTMQ